MIEAVEEGSMSQSYTAIVPVGHPVAINGYAPLEMEGLTMFPGMYSYICYLSLPSLTPDARLISV